MTINWLVTLAMACAFVSGKLVAKALKTDRPGVMIWVYAVAWFWLGALCVWVA